jgi:hypothetical protein
MNYYQRIVSRIENASDIKIDFDVGFQFGFQVEVTSTDASKLFIYVNSPIVTSINVVKFQGISVPLVDSELTELAVIVGKNLTHFNIKNVEMQRKRDQRILERL